ncbi:PrgI family protein [Eubacterium sp.]|uniref:PrgI family protein n=1 Tax=Eubacterium sp. TaxID=142586 RepID=UPI0025909355|nr:PrgI family protein [Eubacterium sp.]MCR5367170.1 PrgI family protein [Eubacterium sp.]
MIEIETSKDIKQHDPRVIGPLSLRQLICVFIAALVALPIVRFLPFSLMARGIIAIVVVSPILACGWGKVYGIPLEKFMLIIIKNKLSSSKRRVYESEDDYWTEKKVQQEEEVVREDFFR